MLHTVFNEFSSLRQAITGKALIPTPSDDIDDAKKGEGMMKGMIAEGREIVEKQDDIEEEKRKAKGKNIAVFQEKPKEKSKLLASSLAAHARSVAHIEQQITEDVVIAMSLQMEQALDLSEKGVAVIPLVQLLQTMPSLAGPSSAQAPAPALTLTALSAPTNAAAPATKKSTPPAAEKKQMTPPPPPAPKVLPKRAAPTEKELDPAAKRQKIQQTITAKASRVVEKKREEEERRRKSEKEERLRAARIRKVEERAAKLWDEVRLI